MTKLDIELDAHLRGYGKWPGPAVIAAKAGIQNPGYFQLTWAFWITSCIHAGESVGVKNVYET